MELENTHIVPSSNLKVHGKRFMKSGSSYFPVLTQSKQS